MIYGESSSVLFDITWLFIQKCHEFDFFYITEITKYEKQDHLFWVRFFQIYQIQNLFDYPMTNLIY